MPEFKQTGEEKIQGIWKNSTVLKALLYFFMYTMCNTQTHLNILFRDKTDFSFLKPM